MFCVPSRSSDLTFDGQGLFEKILEAVESLGRFLKHFEPHETLHYLDLKFSLVILVQNCDCCNLHDLLVVEEESVKMRSKSGHVVVLDSSDPIEQLRCQCYVCLPEDSSPETIRERMKRVLRVSVGVK